MSESVGSNANWIAMATSVATPAIGIDLGATVRCECNYHHPSGRAMHSAARIQKHCKHQLRRARGTSRARH